MHALLPPMKGKETHKGRGIHRGLCYLLEEKMKKKQVIKLINFVPLVYPKIIKRKSGEILSSCEVTQFLAFGICGWKSASCTHTGPCR